MSTAGELRRSSVPALNVSPQTVTVTPSSDPPAAAAALATTRSRCSSLPAMAPRRRENS